jgi:hypothetical protein
MEPYHGQLPAKKADSKLKKEKKDGPPPTISIVLYPLHIAREGKTCTVPPSTPDYTQINCTGPTLHTAEPQYRRKYDPARQRNSQRPGTPKINRTRDECNKWINTHINTAYKYNEKRKKKKIPLEGRQY